jgi:diaminopimelate epimerase
MTDRRLGVGGDGLILVERGAAAPFRMRMFNPDGSESEMCGNGIRCFAQLARDRGYLNGAKADVETGAGRLVVELTEEGQVRVDMGPARLKKSEIPMAPSSDENFIDQPIGVNDLRGTAVSMGNPHLVIFHDDVKSISLESVGPIIEHSELFPARVNVHFVQVVDRGHLIQRTWERGAGITLACGTGASACCVAGFLNGRSDRRVAIDLPGGHLQLEYTENGNVFMTGPAATVFEGEWGA